MNKEEVIKELDEIQTLLSNIDDSNGRVAISRIQTLKQTINNQKKGIK